MRCGCPAIHPAISRARFGGTGTEESLASALFAILQSLVDSELVPQEVLNSENQDLSRPKTAGR
jgi:hypothetical protein